MIQQTLESDRRLSECMLWRLQEDFYTHQGIDAWNTIPFYPTCNAFIGKVYAELILQFLVDYHVHIKPDQPVHIIEMASGSGAFSFYLMSELAQRKPLFSCLDQIPLVYVMTDFADRNVTAWEKNPSFQRFRDSGMLDFGVFRPEAQETIWLRRAQRELSSKTVKNPVIAIANYFFDSIRNDLFRVEEGRLQEGRVTLTREVEPGNESQAITMEEVQQTQTWTNIDADIYTDPRLNKLLRQYRELYDNATILFPISAIRCIQNLQTLSNNSLALISSDKGFAYADYQQGHWTPAYVLHGGSFSYSCNYHALGMYFRNEGGTWFSTEEKNLTLVTAMGTVLPRPDCSLEQTRYYFTQTVDKENPINNLYFTQSLARSNLESRDEFNACLGLLRVCNNDPVVFTYVGPRLLALLDKIDAWQQETLLDCMKAVRDKFFAVRKTLNALRWLGLIYYEMRHHDECIEAFLASIEVFGEDEISLYHLAACDEVRHQYAEALDKYKRALAMDATCQLTAQAIERCREQLEAQQTQTTEETVNISL